MSSNCTIRLELDRDQEPLFRDTEPLAGTVYVEVDGEVDCEGLVVERRWETHGRGDPEQGGESRDTLFEGTWESSGTYEYPFEMSLPAGPYSYRGQHVNIDWCMEARAEVPWAGDAEDRAEFVLEPGGSEGFVPGIVDRAEFRDRYPEAYERSSTSGLLFGTVVTAFGLFIAVIPGATGGPPLVGLMSLPLLGFGLWWLYRAFRNNLSEMAFSDIEVDVSSREVAPGQRLDCRVRLVPSRDLDLNEIRCLFEGREYAETGRGTDHKSYTETVHEDEVVPEEASEVQLRAGEPSEFQVAFTVPETAAYTFEGRDNRLEWKVQVDVDIDNWPDWRQNTRLLVRPGPGGGVEEGVEAAGDAEAESASADAAEREAAPAGNW